MREDGQSRAKALRFRQPGSLGHVAVVERDVRLPGGALGGLAGEDFGLEAWIVGLEEKTGDLVVIGPAQDHRHVREGGVADPLLLATQHITAVFLYGRRAQRARVAPRLWFCQAEAADLLALRHGRQPTPLLLLRSQLVYGRHREPALDVQKGSQAPRPPRQLGDRKAVGHVVPSGATILLREDATHEAELPEP